MALPMLDFDGRKLIVGVGSALVDVLAREDDAFVRRTGAARGGMTYVDHPFIEKTLTQFTGPVQVVPGGSACNTVLGIGRLGGRARFVGKVGTDEYGQLFKSGLIQHRVEPWLSDSSIPTGRVLSIVTPDAERSMFTYLGASAQARPADISADCFRQAAIVHVEGYLLFNHDLILRVMQVARDAGARVSLDLASYTVVESDPVFLGELIDRHVNILLANEDEARVFTGCSDECEALQALSHRVDLAVLKVGPNGSYIAQAGRRLKIEPIECDPVIDTTGAGDLWAAGFLYGLINGWPLEACGRAGSLCGAEVCRVMGACIPDQGWLRILDHLKKQFAGQPATD